MTEEVELVARGAKREWWPLAALAVVLLVAAGSLVTTADAVPDQPQAKAVFLDTAPLVVPLDAVIAPEPSVSPDPQTFIQQIEIILPPPPPPPGGSGGTGGGSGGGGVTLNKADAGTFCANINAQRTSNGLAALASCYATTTRQKHANAMAATSPPAIWHQGDNIVGVAPSHSQLIAAFMASQGHHDQILTASYTTAKVGCTWGQPPGYNPHIYCTADFS